ncbi:MAG: TonB-dependent receptor [Myxococcales bacterium]|nr:TonB-dependent receptor [Myxococcales bacterium]
MTTWGRKRGRRGRLPPWSAAVMAFGLTFGLSAHAQVPAPAAPIVAPTLRTKVEPVYPPDLLADGLRGTVVVELDLDSLGAVTKATVVTSAGPQFDAAALVAARGLVFAPAMQAGGAVPVRIRYRFDFAPLVALDRRGLAPSLGRYDRRGLEQAPAGFASLEGRVLERGTGRPVPGALVTMPALATASGPAPEAVTDADGHFRFGLLRSGVHEVYLPGSSHKPLRAPVTIASGKTTTLTLRPERLSYSVYRATAERPPEPGEMARRSLGIEEIQKIPGVQGDAFKVVQNLPGVARGTAGNGLLIVRGSAPQDTQVNVEGVRVPLMYHFAGLYSILNTDLLDAIDFYPGGYPVRYGRQTGGIVTARLAVPKEGDPWHGYLESNVFHTGFFLSGPLGKDTHLTAAARRSYIDFVLDAVISTFDLKKFVPFTLAPRYYDAQLKLDHRIGPRTDATVMLFGTDDGLKALVLDPPPAFPDARGDVNTRSSFWTLMGIVRHRGDKWTATTTLGALLATADASIFDVFRFEAFGREYTFRQDFTLGEGPLQLRTGVDLVCNPYEIEVYAPPLRATGERGQFPGPPPDRNTVFTHEADLLINNGAWFDAVFRLHPRWEVVPGLRLDHFGGASQGLSVTPRLNLRHKWNERLTFKAAVGGTTQRPQPHEVSVRFGNPDLKPVRGFEVAAGGEFQASEAIDIDLQGFQKELRDLAVVPDGIVPRPPFVNTGVGHVSGLELLVRHKPVGPFFGWIAYTLQRATRIDRPGVPERPFGWDQTHILTALGSYKLPDNWEVGARWRYVTGNPLTDVETVAWNEKQDTYTRVRSACNNCGRLPAFHQLDVRVDKKWVYESWMLSIYMDVQNVYNRQNAESIRYNFDASLHEYQAGLPIVPALGARAEF